MKLAILALAGLLGLGSIAHAEQPGNGPRSPHPRAPLRAALLARFDHNHDGQLQPQERRQAIRALRRLTRKLAREQQGAARRVGRERELIQRFDVDGDGDVGPGELPPELADRMRPLDRNGDGWVDDADQ